MAEAEGLLRERRPASQQALNETQRYLSAHQNQFTGALVVSQPYQNFQSGANQMNAAQNCGTQVTWTAQNSQANYCNAASLNQQTCGSLGQQNG